jgi:hypothetical protein
MFKELFDHVPIRRRRIEPYTDPTAMADIFRHVKPTGSFCGKPLTCAARRFQIQGDAAIAVVIVKKPAEPSAAHLETQVAVTLRHSPRFRQRAQQRNDLPAAPGRGGRLVYRTGFAHDLTCFDLGLVTLPDLPMYARFKAVISSFSSLSMACITRSDFRHFRFTIEP